MSVDHVTTVAARADHDRWARRPVLGRIVRAVAFVGPVVVSIAFAWVLTDVTPAPSTLTGAILKWTAIAVVSSFVLVGAERAARRLLPIAALLDLSLSFPDHAPSRLRVALRTSTTARLERRLAEAQAGRRTDTPAEAATRVIELVASLRVHDRITRGHSERVWGYTEMIAEEMGLDGDEMDKLRWAGLLHDVGKLLVPTSILNKTKRLTAAEYEIVKTHPENGRLIVAPLVPWLGESARAVWEHHEKWDGTGYPRGLRGEEISLAARIVAVADVYDVLTSTRSYKEPISPREARRELARCAGTHFDPAVVRAFLNVSIGRVRRAAGPVAWLGQLWLFPAAVLTTSPSLGTAAVLTGAIGASSAGIGMEAISDIGGAVDSGDLLALDIGGAHRGASGEDLDRRFPPRARDALDSAPAPSIGSDLRAAAPVAVDAHDAAGSVGTARATVVAPAVAVGAALPSANQGANGEPPAHANGEPGAPARAADADTDADAGAAPQVEDVDEAENAGDAEGNSDDDEEAVVVPPPTEEAAETSGAAEATASGNRAADAPSGPHPEPPATSPGTGRGSGKGKANGKGSGSP